MAERIEPIKLSQLAPPVEKATAVAKPGNVFDEVLGKAIDALNGVSEVELTANQLIDDYAVGKAELSDVMVATAKMTVAVQLAVTAITSAVNTFKEITQMPI